MQESADLHQLGGSKKSSGGFQHGKSSGQNRSNQESQDHYERIIRKRKRKSSDQLKSLMREFERNPNWSKDTLLEVSKKTGLSEAQVYKWGWDQKRKTFGPEAAALMMAPLSQFEHLSHFDENEKDEESFGNHHD